MKTHLDYLLTAYLFESLSEAGREEVEAHLAGCASCREELEELRATLGLLGDAVGPTVEDDSARYSFEARRLERVLQARGEHRWLDRIPLKTQRAGEIADWIRRHRLSVGLAAAATIVVGLFGVALISASLGRRAASRLPELARATPASGGVHRALKYEEPASDRETADFTEHFSFSADKVESESEPSVEYYKRATVETAPTTQGADQPAVSFAAPPLAPGDSAPTAASAETIHDAIGLGGGASGAYGERRMAAVTVKSGSIAPSTGPAEPRSNLEGALQKMKEERPPVQTPLPATAATPPPAGLSSRRYDVPVRTSGRRSEESLGDLTGDPIQDRLTLADGQVALEDLQTKVQVPTEMEKADAWFDGRSADSKPQGGRDRFPADGPRTVDAEERLRRDERAGETAMPVLQLESEKRLGGTGFALNETNAPDATLHDSRSDRDGNGSAPGMEGAGISLAKGLRDSDGGTRTRGFGLKARTDLQSAAPKAPDSAGGDLNGRGWSYGIQLWNKQGNPQPGSGGAGGGATPGSSSEESGTASGHFYSGFLRSDANDDAVLVPGQDRWAGRAQHVLDGLAGNYQFLGGVNGDARGEIPTLGDLPDSGRLFRDLSRAEESLRAYSHYRGVDPELSWEAFEARRLPIPPPEIGDEGLGEEAFRHHYGVHPFVDALKDPLSTFGMDVDVASYRRALSQLRAGRFPGPETVRTEAFINSFPVHCPTDGDEAFFVCSEGGPAPFGRRRRPPPRPPEDRRQGPGAAQRRAKERRADLRRGHLGLHGRRQRRPRRPRGGRQRREPARSSSGRPSGASSAPWPPRTASASSPTARTPTSSCPTPPPGSAAASSGPWTASSPPAPPTSRRDSTSPTAWPTRSSTPRPSTASSSAPTASPTSARGGPRRSSRRWRSSPTGGSTSPRRIRHGEVQRPHAGDPRQARQRQLRLRRRGPGGRENLPREPPLHPPGPCPGRQDPGGVQPPGGEPLPPAGLREPGHPGRGLPQRRGRRRGGGTRIDRHRALRAPAPPKAAATWGRSSCATATRAPPGSRSATTP